MNSESIKSCLVVASHFPPSRAAGVFRTLRLVKYLPALGWEIEVLTLEPGSYLADCPVDDESIKNIPDNVRMHRTIAYHPCEWKKRITATRHHGTGASRNAKKSNGRESRSKRVGWLQLAKDTVTLPLMTPDRWVGWFPFATRRGKRILRERSFDLLYSSGPPWTNHLVARRLQTETLLPWVADFRDPWLGNDFRPQRQGNSWAGRRHRALEKAVVECAAIVIVNTDRALRDILARYPSAPPSKFRVITNGFDPDDFAGLEDFATTTGTANRSLTMVHAGAFYGNRTIVPLLNSLADLIDEKRISKHEFELQLIGAADSGSRASNSERNTIATRGLQECVHLLPSMPHAECLKRLAAADVLLLVQTGAPLCIPGKLFEYMAIGKRVFTLAGEGATADLVTLHDMGPCVAPDGDIKASLLDLIAEHREGQMARTRNTVTDCFNAANQAKQFDEAFRSAMECAQPR